MEENLQNFDYKVYLLGMDIEKRALIHRMKYNYWKLILSFKTEIEDTIISLKYRKREHNVLLCSNHDKLNKDTDFSSGVILTFDTSDISSFKLMKGLYRAYSVKVDAKCSILLGFSYIQEDKKVPSKDIIEFSENHNLKYFEIEKKRDILVVESFYYLLEKLVKRKQKTIIKEKTFFEDYNPSYIKFL